MNIKARWLDDGFIMYRYFEDGKMRMERRVTLTSVRIFEMMDEKLINVPRMINTRHNLHKLTFNTSGVFFAGKYYLEYGVLLDWRL